MHPSERKPDRLFGRCECSSLRDDAGCVCNLYSITTNQAAIIALFRVINRYVGALLPVVCDTLFLGGLLYLGDSMPAAQRYAQPLGLERAMFDVYLNGKGDLLVVPRGLPIPNSETGRWRKKKTKVAAVSDEIRLAIQRRGYYRRKLGEPVSTNNGIAARS
jgi:hypothetical protein